MPFGQEYRKLAKTKPKPANAHEHYARMTDLGRTATKEEWEAAVAIRNLRVGSRPMSLVEDEASSWIPWSSIGTENSNKILSMIADGMKADRASLQDVTASIIQSFGATQEQINKIKAKTRRCPPTLRDLKIPYEDVCRQCCATNPAARQFFQRLQEKLDKDFEMQTAAPAATAKGNASAFDNSQRSNFTPAGMTNDLSNNKKPSSDNSSFSALTVLGTGASVLSPTGAARQGISEAPSAGARVAANLSKRTFTASEKLPAGSKSSLALSIHAVPSPASTTFPMDRVMGTSGPTSMKAAKSRSSLTSSIHAPRTALASMPATFKPGTINAGLTRSDTKAFRSSLRPTAPSFVPQNQKTVWVPRAMASGSGPLDDVIPILVLQGPTSPEGLVKASRFLLTQGIAPHLQQAYKNRNLIFLNGIVRIQVGGIKLTEKQYGESAIVIPQTYVMPSFATSIAPFVPAAITSKSVTITTTTVVKSAHGEPFVSGNGGSGAEHARADENAAPNGEQAIQSASGSKEAEFYVN